MSAQSSMTLHAFSDIPKNLFPQEESQLGSRPRTYMAMPKERIVSEPKRTAWRHEEKLSAEDRREIRRMTQPSPSFWHRGGGYCVNSKRWQ